MPDIRAAIFDAYGTLLDVHAPVLAQAERIGPHWRRFSADWRAKQLEYTWVRSLTGPAHHRDFWRCTEDALDWVSARHGLSDPDLRAGLAAKGLSTIHARHTCAHRVDELFAVVARLQGVAARSEPQLETTA